MATSGSIDFNLTLEDIITDSLELLGVLGEGETPNADQITSAQRTLNMMLKHWQTRGTQLWVVQTLWVFLEEDKITYDLGLDVANSDRTAVGRDLVITTMDGDQLSGATSITVADTTGMTAGDEIGINTSDNACTLYWDTIVSVDSATTLTITNGLDADTNDNSPVYTFTTRAARPRRILTAQVRQNAWIAEGTDTPIEIIARQDYEDLSQKATEGLTNQLYYDPQWKTGEITFWPSTNCETDIVRLRVERTVEDLDATTDDFDLPHEWYLAIAYNLAKWSAPKFGTSDANYQKILGLAAESLFDAESGDVEDYIRMTPDDRWRDPEFGRYI